MTLALMVALPGVAGADEADAHYRAGLAFKQQGKTDEAIQEFLEALKLRKDYAAAEFSLGVTYKMRNQLQPAVDHLEKAAKLQPKTADAHASLGMTYYGLGTHRRRHPRARQGRRAQPEQRHVAVVARQALPREEGVRQGDPAPRAGGDARSRRTPSALSNLGVAYRQTNKIAEAEKYFLKALELKPDQADFHFNLGVVYRRQQKAQEAIAEYEKAIKLDDRMAVAHYDLGVMLAQQKRNDEAIKRVEPLPRLEGGSRIPKRPTIVRKHIKELGGTPH